MSQPALKVRMPALPETGKQMRRLFPASFASLLFHGLLFAVMVLLSSSGQAEVRIESVPSESIIGTETQTYDPAKDDPFLSTVPNEGSTERYQDPALNLSVKDEVTIPVNPTRDTPGIKDGKTDGLLRDFGPEFGLTLNGNGRAGAFDGNNPKTNSPFDPGGILQGGSNPKLLDAIRGSGVTKDMLLKVGGGTGESEAAVTRGLQWLLRHQLPDGSWRLDGNFPDKGAQNDIAGTAFGLLPLLGAGKTHKSKMKDDPYDKPIEKALNYLKAKQDKRTGNFGGGMYGHGLATIAVCEAYGMTQDQALKRTVQLAINYIVTAQHDGGGWRYAPGQAGDLSVSGWQIMALKSAQMAGLDVPEITIRKAQRFLDQCVSPTDEGYGYIGVGSTPTMSAVGLLCRQYLQSWGPQNVRLIKSIDLHLKPNPPNRKKDIYYYYYATQVMRHFGGESWTAWNKVMRDGLVQSQVNDPKNPQDGSWSSVGDLQSTSGGRLMVTSLNLLTLEVYYRHLPLYFRDMGAKNEMNMKKSG